MGEQTPLRGSQRHAGRPARRALRLAGLAVVLASVVVLTGCSEQTQARVAEPRHAGPRVRAGRAHLHPVAVGLGRGADHRRHRLGPDVLGHVALPPQGRRPRDPGADALQPAARDLLHDRPGHHGDRLLRAHRRHAERRARRRGRARPHHRRRRPAVAVDLQLRRRARGRLAQPLGGRHRVLHPDARAAGGRDHRVPPALARRDPRLRRARLPDEDGRHPRPRTTTTASRPP